MDTGPTVAQKWSRQLTLQDGSRVFVRPIRPEDEALYKPFLERETAEDLRYRFFAPVRELSRAAIARFTRIDFASSMAFIALDAVTGAMLGVARLHATDENGTGEYAVIVRSDLKGRGLGWQLTHMIIEFARAKGFHTIEGQVLQENKTMLTMCRELGFEIATDPRDATIAAVKLRL